MDEAELAIFLEEVQAWLGERGGPILDAGAIWRAAWKRIWDRRADKAGVVKSKLLEDAWPRMELRKRIGVSRL